MTSVWLATTGSYSDYVVLVAFTTQALADQYVKDHNAQPHVGDSGVFEEARVEECLLLDSVPGPDQIIWHANVSLKDGAVEQRQTWSHMIHPWEEMPQYEVHEEPHYYVISGPDRNEAERRVGEWVARKIANA